MDHLYRELAPISDSAWEQIETEAKSRLVTHLAARKLSTCKARAGGITPPRIWAVSRR